MKPRTLPLAAALCFAGAAHAADYTMRISHQFPPAHQTARALDQFAADVKKNTGGKAEVQIFGAAQLYKPNQNHPAVAGGKIESAAILSFQWGGTIPEMSVTAIPYLMSHAQQLKAFPSSEAAKMLNAKMEAKGVHNIAWIVDANDGIFTSSKRLLVKPEDFKGIKIRGLNKLFDAGLEAVGAAPVAMPAPEMYQALQTGVIDAGFTGVQAAFSRRFYEVQKFGAASNIITVYDNLVVNPQWWNGLPAGVRSGIEAAARKAESSSVPAADGIPAQWIQQLRDKGMEVAVLTPAQEKALAGLMQPAVLKAFSGASPDAPKVLEQLKNLK